MPCIKSITITFFSFRKTTHSTILSQVIKAVFSSGQDLMGIGLVSHIPDHFIFWKLKAEMHRHGKLYDSKVGGKMTAGSADLLDQESADFFCQSCQFPFI